MAKLTIDQALEKGIAAHKAGQLQEADRLYTAILKAQPKHPNANHNMGVLAVGCGKVEQALRYFQTALAANSSTGQFWLSYIDALILLARLADAKVVLDQAKSKGAKGDGFDLVEQRLNDANRRQSKKNNPSSDETGDPSKILNSLKLDQALKLAKKKAKEGALEEAKPIYQAILAKFPGNKQASDELKGLSGRACKSPQDQAQSLIKLYNQGQMAVVAKQAQALTKQHPEAFIVWNILGAASLQIGKLDQAIFAFQKVISIKPDSAEAHNNIGVTLQKQGKLDDAIEAYNKALAIKPNNIEAYSNMGNALKDQGKLDKAVEAYNKALTIKSDNAEVYSNMGNVLKDQGKLEEALRAHNQAIAIKPDHSKAHYNKAITLQEQGKLEEAIEAYKQALAITPDYAQAFNNMGVTLKEQGKLDAAIGSYNKSLAIRPDYAEAYYNMGNAFKEQCKLEEAIEAYQKALGIKSDYAKAYNNMGNALQDQGKLEGTIEAYNKAIAIKADYAEAWNNIVIPLQSIKLKISDPKELIPFYPQDTGSNNYEAYRAILNYIMNQGSADAVSILGNALKALGNSENIVVKNPDYDRRNFRAKMPLTDQVVALVHWGRSGTGLLHSLIDDHPEVSTVPSIYLSEYFNHSSWERIISDGWSQMADRFMSIYDVIFDARSKTPVQSSGLILLYGIGLKEGMANVGDKRDEVLKVDKEVFRAELHRLMNFYDQLDALLFFKLVHIAYDRAINNIHQKSLIFYHIHNPSTQAQLNFVRLAPKANWVMMVREPLQSCESWLRRPFEKNDYVNIATRIRTMFFQIDTIIYHKKNSVGVRLEDLKERPRQTIPALCNWMGIKETESLYEMTAQGKKWWGDPSSSDFAQDGMNPFGKTSINRKIGSIFSENDQYILQTLFYPFSVRFGYIEENAEQFEIDLQTIRPMMDNMFDFEKTIVELTHADPEQFMKSGLYLYLRSALIERWDILKEHGTYPNMIKPLKIQFNEIKFTSPPEKPNSRE